PAGPKVAISAVLPAADAGKFWPRFRGPSGQGLTGLKSLPVAWSKDSDNIVWRVRVPGQGNSSPITWGDRIFLTSAGEGGKDRFVHCLSKEDGKLLWSRTVPERPTEPSVRDKNGYASATPVTDGERVIAFLGTCGLVCYDFKGNLKWQFDDFRVATTHGTGSRAVVFGNGLIYSASGRNGPTIALRPGGSGDVTETHLAWRAVRGGPHVPAPIYLDGRLYTVNDFGVVTCHDAATGRLIWQQRLADRFSASPIEAGGLLYFPAESGITYVLKV